jgi:hypothetical protein
MLCLPRLLHLCSLSLLCVLILQGELTALGSDASVASGPGRSVCFLPIVDIYNQSHMQFE